MNTNTDNLSVSINASQYVTTQLASDLTLTVKPINPSKHHCDFILHILSPRSPNLYTTISQVTDDSNKHSRKTLLIILRGENGYRFDNEQWKQINQIADIVEGNGIKVFDTILDAATYMNEQNNKATDL